jgi:hypothetical protein
MPQAVSFSGAGGRAGTYLPDAPSSVGLRAKLDRYEKQLSDCVNCASARTPEGRAAAVAPSMSPLGSRIDTYA